MTQLNLDLGDRKEYLKALINRLEKNELQYSGTSLVICSSSKKDHYWLTLRTFNYDTEYDHIELLSKEDAIYVCKHHNVSPGWDTDFRKEWSNAQPVSG
jgi:gluconate kinase